MISFNIIFNKLLPPKATFSHNQNHNTQSGQTFVEFIFLMVTVMIMSITLHRGVSYGLAKKWEQAVNLIVAPSKVDL